MKLTASQRLLLACVISALVPAGLALGFQAAQGWPSGWAATVLLVLAAALLAAALAAVWAGLGRPASAQDLATPADDNRVELWQQASAELAATLDPGEVAAGAARLARQLLGADSALVYSAEPGRRNLRLLESNGAPHALLADEQNPAEGAASLAAKRGEVVVQVLGQGQAAGLPLYWREQLVGAIELRKARPFEPLVRSELAPFAALAGGALGNARRHLANQREAERLAILHRASQAISRSLDVEEVCFATDQAVGQLMPNEAFAIGLLDSAAQTVEVVYVTDGGQRQPGARLPASAGLMGEVLRQGQPLLFYSQADWPPGLAHLGRSDLAQSAIVVPMRAGERLLGILTTQAYRPNAFSDDDVPPLTTLANQAAAAIHNARLYEASERQARELDVLVKAQNAASASLDLPAVLRAVAEQLGRALNVTSAYVVEISGAQVATVAEYYSPEASAAERVSDLNQTYPLEQFRLAHQVLAGGAPVTVSANDPNTPAAERDHLRRFGTCTALVVPLLRQGKAIGYASLWESRGERVFTEAEQRLAKAIAGYAAAALENARLYTAARRHAEQMRAVNQIGRDITGLLEAEALLVQVARRLETTFGYYHAKLGVIAGDAIEFPARPGEPGHPALPALRLPVDGPGLIAAVARSGRPRYVVEVQADPDFQPSALLPGTVAEAAVPLISHGQLLGVLDVQSDQPAALGPEDGATLEAIGSQVAVALDNARLFAEARQRTAEVSALLSTTIAVTSSMDLDARLQAIAEHARRLVAGDSCTIYQLSADGKTLLPLVALDELYAQETLNDLVVVGQGLIGQSIQAGAPVLANRADLDPRAMQIPGTPPTPECMMVVPLQAGARITGGMAVYREGVREFSRHDLDLLASFAAQAAVAIENAELYHELRERADSLQATYNELAEMDRLKDEMVQNISHELRTPLTFLKSYVELLLNGALGPLQPEQTRSLQVVMNKTSTLVRLVNDIITLQAVTPATINRARLDLLEVARAAADGVAALANEAGVELVTRWPAGSIAVRGDALRLGQVFDNLLGNAIKFTSRGGQIYLSVEPDGSCVRVEVRDTGIGIAPESIERIFDRFYQVDGTPTRRRGGIGLGLAICKLIVEVHGGQIGVESQVGTGSAFYFTLPLADGA